LNMFSSRAGLSSTNTNRAQTAGLKSGLKATVAKKNTVAGLSDVGQVKQLKQENHKPSLPALTIKEAFEGQIASSSSPLTAEKATQDVIKVECSVQTSLSFPAVPVRNPIPGETREEAEQSEEYWRQMHEAMEVSLAEAVDRKLEATKLLEFQQQKLDDSLDRLQSLREINAEIGLDAEALETLEHPDDREMEFTGEIYRTIFDSE
ncbi:hypothetical protein PENTCL1PPCAC_13551, partial [Pristionchus entomophagus]